MTDLQTPLSQERVSLDACWNRIGVYGDKTCPELEKHIHCRNCPVYSKAAIYVLDRDRDSGALLETTRLFSANKVMSERGTHSAFIFRIHQEWLALSTSVFDEVADLRSIHPVPHRRDGVVLGLANIRGELLACMSLSVLLGIEDLQAGPPVASQITHKRLLIIGAGRNRIAFPVDQVHGAERYNHSSLTPVPSTLSKSMASYSRAILSWNDHSIGLLDDELLFHSFTKALA